MADRRIPVLRVAGGHRDVGRQVGAATADVLRREIAFDHRIPAGRSRPEQLALARRFRDATLASTPWLVDEIDGAAEGAGIDPLALFAASIEEIWTVRPSGEPVVPHIVGRCSDIVAGPPATADGHLWVAHTNDLAADEESGVVAIEWRVPGEPVVFSLGIGPWISVGWNDAGLSLTGNELSPNDERVGVPRLLMVREQLTARTIDDATAMALRPDRASSYNTVFAHRDGRVVDVEGSATDAELGGLDERGTLAHTNHYVGGRMLGYEGDPAYARASAVRLGRACELLASAGPRAITPEWLRSALSDHATDPSLCRHARAEGPVGGTGASGAATLAGGAVSSGASTKTVFWCIADVTSGEVRYGLGNPCAPGEERYAF
jgi:hypothetical protein